MNSTPSNIREKINEIIKNKWHEYLSNDDEELLFDVAGTTDQLVSLMEEAIKEERKRIMGRFILAGSMDTMFQTDERIHWAYEQMRKNMLEILEMDALAKIKK